MGCKFGLNGEITCDNPLLEGELAPGSSGPSGHEKLLHRDFPDQHPMSAITGLETELDNKQPKRLIVTINYLNVADHSTQEIYDAYRAGSDVIARYQQSNYRITGGSTPNPSRVVFESNVIRSYGVFVTQLVIVGNKATVNNIHTYAPTATKTTATVPAGLPEGTEANVQSVVNALAERPVSDVNKQYVDEQVATRQPKDFIINVSDGFNNPTADHYSEEIYNAFISGRKPIVHWMKHELQYDDWKRPSPNSANFSAILKTGYGTSGSTKFTVQFNKIAVYRAAIEDATTIAEFVPATVPSGITAEGNVQSVLNALAERPSGGGTGQKGVGENAEAFNGISPENAFGKNSHVEGIRTFAYGAQSHSEGFAPLEKKTGVLNVVTSEVVGTGKNQHTQMTVNVAKENCVVKRIDVTETVVGFKIDTMAFNKHTVFMYENKACDVFDFVPQDSITADPQNILIKIAEIVTIPTGNVNITFVEQGAIGTTSHAEGGKTIASGQASHTEGFGSKVLYKTESGDPIGAHAEGTNTIAMGKGSHAEGGDTHAEGKYSHAEGEETLASSMDSHAEGFQTIASGKYSHAEGQGTTASGDNSHAEGDSTTASGYRSHAEGYQTTASEYGSHAEGEGTTASGNGSHAEGGETTASGSGAHAEGFNTTASGYVSHAEGDSTKASGKCSHAEGIGTTASGYRSHAEGFNTTASSDNQHVQGKYNIDDPTGEYAHIVGNGDYSKRSNAHTLDWDGNAWYQASVLVGGTDMDTPDASLLPDGIIIKAQNSTKKFKITVDDTGVIKATEV